MAGLNDGDVAELMQNQEIIRNRAKIFAAKQNARCYLKMQEAGRPLASFLWQFTNGETKVNQFAALSDLPSKTELSDRISKELKSLGFSFMGSTVVYAHLQATGIVNDHLMSCFRYSELTHNPH